MLRIRAVLISILTATLLAVPAHAGTPGPIDAIQIGPHTTGSHPVTLVNKGPITVSLGAHTLPCASAAGSGSVHAGGSGVTAIPNPHLTITGTAIIGCQLWLGIPVNLIQTCDLTVTWSPQDVDTALIDSVASQLHVTECLSVQDGVTGDICNLDIAGSVDATFHEPDKGDPGWPAGDSAQELTISGDTLTIVNVDCLDEVEENDQIDFALTFNVISEEGPINFVP